MEIKTIKYFAYAKVNLVLEVLGKHSSGYHFIASIMQSIDLADEIMFSKLEGEVFTLKNEGSIRVSPTADNLIFKAWQKLSDYFEKRLGLEVILKKEIPVQAGLGGGSADAAATLVALVHLYNLHITPFELEGIAKGLGKDIPFHLKGGTAKCSGFGDEITILPNPDLDYYLLLVKPTFSISTEAAYEELKSDLVDFPRESYKIDSMLYAIAERDIWKVIANLHNDFMKLQIRKFPETIQIIETLKTAGAINVFLTGSGSTVVGFFREISDEQKIKDFIFGKCQHLIEYIGFHKPLDYSLLRMD